MSEREHIEERVFEVDDMPPTDPSVEPAGNEGELPGIFHTPNIIRIHRDLDPKDGAVIGLDINSDGAIRNLQRHSDVFFDLVQLDMKGEAKGDLLPLKGIRLVGTRPARYSNEPEGLEDNPTNSPGNIERRSAKTFGYLEDSFDDRNREDIFDGVIGHAHRGGRLEQEAQRRNRAVFDRQAWKDLKSNE